MRSTLRRYDSVADRASLQRTRLRLKRRMEAYGMSEGMSKGHMNWDARTSIKTKIWGTNDWTNRLRRILHSLSLPEDQLHTNRIKYIYTTVSRLQRDDDKLSTATKTYRCVQKLFLDFFSFFFN